MSNTRISGAVFNRQGLNELDRVIALGGDQQILGEARLGQSIQWSLETSGVPNWIVAQLSGSRLGAVAVRPADADRIYMPELIQLRLGFESIVQGAALWLDPVELEEFPQELMWALRMHPNRIIDLHVGEFPVTEVGVQLKVQRGRYRLSGGRFNMHPGVEESQGTVILAQATDEATGEIFESIGGEIVVDVHEPDSYELSFTSGN